MDQISTSEHLTEHISILSLDLRIKYDDFYTSERTNPFSPALGVCLMRKEKVLILHTVFMRSGVTQTSIWGGIFLTSAWHANAHAARASLGAGPGKEAVTLPNSLWPSVILRLRPRELLAIGCKRLWASQKMGLTLHYLLKLDLNIRCFNHGETAPMLRCHISGLVRLIWQKSLVKSYWCSHVLYTKLNLGIVHREYYINQ